MIKISKKICFFLTLIFLLVSFQCGNYFFSGNLDTNLFPAALFGVPAIMYLVYIFLPVKKLCAYTYAFASNILIDIAFFWRLWPEIFYYEFKYPKNHEAIPDIVIDAYIFAIMPVALNAVIFSLVYWVVYYISLNIPKKVNF